MEKSKKLLRICSVCTLLFGFIAFSEPDINPESFANTSHVAKEAQKSTNGWNQILHKQETTDSSIGYIVVDTYAYHFTYDLYHLFRVDQRVEFTPGSLAIGPGYDKHWKGDSATIQNTFDKYTFQNHYGQFETPKPMFLNYWPKNSCQYKTITSGYSGGPAWGHSSSAGIEGSTDSFGGKADSQFSSQFNINYHYSETYTASYPSVDSKELSTLNGYGINLTKFNGSGITPKTIVITSGMLFESKMPDNSAGYDILATLTTKIDFKVHAYLDHRTISYNKTLNLKNN